EETAQLQQISIPQTLFGSDLGIPSRHRGRRTAYVDRLAIGAGSLAERNGQFRGRPDHHGDATLDEHEVHRGYVQLVIAGWNADHFETAVLVCRHRAAVGLQTNGHTFERRAAVGVDDHTTDRATLRLRQGESHEN